MKFVTNNKEPHLGGNIAEGDPATWCPAAWREIIKDYSIESVMDVGSGAGHAAKWFSEQGLKVIAVEGLKDNVDNAVYPTFLHDITQDAYRVENIDLVNCIEVVEHIEEKYLDNLLTTLCQGKYLFMTHAVPGQGGHHHVNCRTSEYWIDHLRKRSFKLLSEESKKLQALAKDDRAIHVARNGMLFMRESV
jgi:SAM-dependent methyltransferase